MDRAGNLSNARLRARRDLIVTSGDGGVVVKDPLTLEYFRFGDRERFLLEELRQPLSLAELTRRFRQRFPNERATGGQVMAFCSSMVECSLLLVDGRGRGERSNAKSPNGFTWLSLLSPLAIRLPGFDPTPLLRATSWLGRIVFSTPFVGMLTVALLLVAIGWLGAANEVAVELGRFADLFQPQHALAAIVAVVVTKTWHELGHAIACRRMGAECHEIGVMLLALMPCLYCDVSDAWTLRSRGRRVLVALAGVYFELILAVAAGAAWLVLADGPLRVLAMYTVVVASVSTVLVNLNPLLRFDGYYVLADAWGVANLHQRSRAALWGWLRRWVHSEPNAEEPAASPPLLAAYGLASTIYSWCLLAVILWAVYQSLKAIGFAAAGDILVLLSLGGVAVAGTRSAQRLLPRGPGKGKLKPLLRFGVVAAIAVGGCVWGLARPLEQSLRSPCRLESTTLAEIVAREEGLLTPAASYGDTVTAGQLLAKLSDPASELRRLELLEREATLAAELEGLRTRSQQDATLFSQIAQLTPTLAEVRRQLRTHDRQAESLRLRAPITGRLLPPTQRLDAADPNGELPTWSGVPLDASNAGCLLAEGEVLGRVVGEGLRAVVLLDEHDSGLLNLGDPVRIALDRDPAGVLSGRVARIAPATADEHLMASEVALERGMRQPLQTGSAYRVTVELEAATPACQPGALGTARLITGRETVGGWCLRLLRRLVRFG